MVEQRHILVTLTLSLHDYLCAAFEGRRLVATDATKPDSNFYVESEEVDIMADEMATGLVMLYGAPRQSGKTTDALAVCRRLRKHGIEVQPMLAFFALL